jgi:regulator of protease activity HflC (stomatin/prohibitin superfamily)
MLAIEKLTATTLRNIIGDLELDDTLTSRDLINSKMRIILDEVSDAWGIKVIRVEVKNILPPPDIQEAMEKQMRAEREKREAILRAEGDKISKITIAQGDKESVILKAEAEKEKRMRKRKAKRKHPESRRGKSKGLELLKNAMPINMSSQLKVWKHWKKLPTEKLQN